MKTPIRILIADDDQTLADLAQCACEMANIGETKIVIRNDGQEAIRCIEEAGDNIFDLIITDLKMPKADGLAVAQAAKARSSGTKIVMVTGTPHENSEVIKAQYGLTAYITKPYLLQEVVTMIEQFFPRNVAQAA